MNKITTSGRRGNTGKFLVSLGALALAGLVAATGPAFTGGGLSTSGPAAGSSFVGGSVVNSMAYTLNDSGTNVNSVTLVMAGDTTLIPANHTKAPAVSIGFNELATTPCGAGSFAAAVEHQAALLVDPFTPEVLAAPAQTTYICKGAGDANFTQATADLTSTAVVVS